jgi:hypothetical protein
VAPVTAIIDVTYGQYFLHGDLLVTDAWSYTGSNGLVGVLDEQGQPSDIGEFAIVLTGTDSGDVKVTVDVLTQAPPEADTEHWDEVVEASLYLTGDSPRLTTVESGLGILDFSGAQPGPYRVRVHARGRDDGHRVKYVSARDGETPEEHLIQVWAAAPAPPRILKLSDACGKIIRGQ